MGLPVSNADMSQLLELLTHNGKQGTGYFDEIMRSVHTHVKGEFEASRISPAEYAEAYTNLVNTSLQGAIQYILQAPAAMHQAALAEKNVKLAEAELAIREKELEIKEQELLQAQKQNELLEAQKAKLIAETDNIKQNTANALEQGKALVFETTSAEHKAKIMEYKKDAEYAQTHDKLPDGSTIGGAIGSDIAIKKAQALTFKCKDMFQMINATMSSNTSQVTVLGETEISPTFTIGSNIDAQIVKYYAELGITV